MSHPEPTAPTILVDPAVDLFPGAAPVALSREQYLRDWAEVSAAATGDGLLPDQPIHWPLTSAVTALVPDAEKQLVRALEAVLSAVETVAARWSTDPELRAFLGVPTAIAERAAREPRGPRAVDYCRFDLAGSRLGEVRVLEVGGDFPGGLPTSGRLNGYWRRTAGVGPLVAGYPPARIEDPGWQIDGLVDLAAERGVDPNGRIGLLVARELHPLPELDLLRAQIRRLGLDPVCLAADDPAAAELTVALLMYPNTPFVTETARYATLLDRIADGHLVTFNGVLGRFVGANKLTLAVLSDPRFAGLFTAAQRAAIDALVPWSRKVGDGVTAAEAVERRAGVVLKSPFDAISDGVVLGREQTDEDWATLLAGDPGWLLQEYVPEQALRTDAGVFHRTLGVAFLAGRPAGHTARLSGSLRATLTPGGGIQSVFGTYCG